MQNNFTNPNVIILLGYMGSGKSTVGVSLAKQIGLPFEDLDDRITAIHKSSIADLFSKNGEMGFRKLEHETLLTTLSDTTPRIISLGGGTPCYHNNMNVINKTTPNVFYLESSPNELATRLFPFKNMRPIIAHSKDKEELKTFIAKHLFERKSFYTQAKHKINVDGISVDEVVAKLSVLI